MPSQTRGQTASYIGDFEGTYPIYKHKRLHTNPTICIALTCFEISAKTLIVFQEMEIICSLTMCVILRRIALILALSQKQSVFPIGISWTVLIL